MVDRSPSWLNIDGASLPCCECVSWLWHCQKSELYGVRVKRTEWCMNKFIAHMFLATCSKPFRISNALEPQLRSKGLRPTAQWNYRGNQNPSKNIKTALGVGYTWCKCHVDSVLLLRNRRLTKISHIKKMLVDKKNPTINEWPEYPHRARVFIMRQSFIVSAHTVFFQNAGQVHASYLKTRNLSIVPSLLLRLCCDVFSVYRFISPTRSM